MKTFLFVVLMLILLTGLAQAQTTLTLNWDAPTTNADGTPLTDLAGFKVYHTTTTGSYNAIDVVDVGNVLTTDRVMPAGSYCFVATAYDASTNESAYSNEVCADVLPPATFQLRITIN